MSYQPTNPAEIERALSFIPANLPREDWIAVGDAIKTEGLDISVFDSWSATADSYKPKECRQQWNSFKGKHTAGTIFHYAKQNGFEFDKTTKPDYQAIEQRKAEQAKKAAEQAKAAANTAKEAAKKCAQIYAMSQPADDSHPYLLKKQVKAHGLRKDVAGNLIIPVFNAEFSVMSLQTISASGEKKFFYQAEFNGGFFLIGEVFPDCEIYITEGYATGATTHQLTGCPVYIAFTAGNLIAVSQFVRSQYEGRTIIICADNDHTDKQGNPRPADKNTGLIAATKSANLINGFVCIPHCKGSDFDDVFLELGHEETVRQLSKLVNPNATEPEPAPNIPANLPQSKKEFTAEEKKEYAQKKEAEKLAVSNGISESTAQAIVKIEKAKKPYALFLSDLVTDSKTDYKAAYKLGMIVFSFEMLKLLPDETINSILNNDVRNNKSYKKGYAFAEAESAIYQLWSLDLIIHVYNFNKTHASVLIGGHHRIMRTIPAAVNQDGRESYEFIPQNALVTVFQNTAIKTGEKEDKNGDLVDVMQNHIVAWAKHKDCKVYTGGVIFKPLPLKKSIAIKDYFNTWKGFAIEPKAGKYEAIKYHIESIVCNGDSELYEYFYNWCAYIFQNPDKPAGAAIVCRGEKGTGKGTIGHFLRMIWGNHGLHISNSNHLTGNFNGHLSDVCFLFADEAYYSANKSHEGVLKALITEPSITIERKGIDAVSQPNYLKVFMATNNDWAVPATKDERRYCVCDVNNLVKGNEAYFDGLHKEVSDPAAQAAFLFDMLHRDLSEFHTGQIPDTAGLKEQRLHSLDSMGKWLVDSLSNGTFSDSDIWKPELSSKELYTSYLAWMETQKTGEYNRFTSTAFGKYLAEIGYTKRTSNGIKWNLGTLEAAIFKFETHERVKI